MTSNICYDFKNILTTTNVLSHKIKCSGYIRQTDRQKKSLTLQITETRLVKIIFMDCERNVTS